MVFKSLRTCERLRDGVQSSQSLARSKVADLTHSAVRVHQHVVAFDVPMDDLLLVQISRQRTVVRKRREGPMESLP